MFLDRISVELTNRCMKGCWFCYNQSQPSGETRWTVDELESLLLDCSRNGVRAVSFGGGDPLEFDGIFELLQRLSGALFRSLTTHGLSLTGKTLTELVATRPDKVHISIHFPESAVEVDRVVRQVLTLQNAGLVAGINLLVSRSNLLAAHKAAQTIREAGIGADQVAYLPMRGFDTPSPEQVARVAGQEPFQSMSCLTGCARSERFCSLAWNKTVAWCSYTDVRRPLEPLTFAGLQSALNGLGLNYCGGAEGHLQQLSLLSGQGIEEGAQSKRELFDTKFEIAQVAEDVEVTGTCLRPIIRVAISSDSGSRRSVFFRWPDGAAVSLSYPAAHSMDVRLHAIDRNGNVAILFAYLGEYIFDDQPEKRDKFEPRSGESWLKDTLWDLELNSQINKDDVIFYYRFNSEHDLEGGRFVAASLPLNPHSLRDILEKTDPRYRRHVSYPWLSFDNAPELTWPPRPPKSIPDLDQLVDAANDYMAKTLDKLIHAERTQAPDIAYWQKIVQRQWESLYQLEQEVEQRKSGIR